MDNMLVTVDVVDSYFSISPKLRSKQQKSSSKRIKNATAEDTNTYHATGLFL